MYKKSAGALIAMLALSALSSAMAADTYKIEGVHTSVLFKAKHMNISWVWGRFNAVEGSVVFDEANPAGSSVEATVKADSVDTGEPKRDAHLKKPDFFDSTQFPTITFKSKSVEKGKDADTFDVTADFTLHGVTKPVKVTFTKTGQAADPKGNAHIGFEGAFTIKRTDYGMNFMVGPVSDEIPITLDIDAVKQ